ncbi:lysylphosphatidylglycerol synthase transmembrane domain-containing protein [Maribacter sp. 4G9]|uniref:lysylphosphatidylglycerol synthase transmembrane domain-containing protein n=1 Tax=Maribacter sp. 4G9 TaxID=1889777 RepID=UPI000C149A5F|nr:lysylphosphatidylglycerol synthase transmembrane domain-containing protein [Maribacter sp. 4G9]PIB26963.1 lysylphosphatidylglycerol synthetase [Maribacter sp. 4G9]
MANPRKTLITALKLLISVALVYFIFTKIDFAEVVDTLKKGNPLYLTAAILLFLMSKVIASFRLNAYFHKLGIPLSQKSNLKLYLLGMFYNLFLPGGIGGDAYKGYLIKKTFEVPTKRVVSVLVLDRLSGLLLLFVYACFLLLALKNQVLEPYWWVFLILIPLSVGVFYYLNKKFFNYVLPIFWKSIGYSAMVQFAQLFCVLCIMRALSIETNIIAYLVIFLVSSIVSVVPLTIGGLGSREVTFFYGAAFLNLEESTSVGISVVFFLITALVSLTGIFFHFRKIKLETTAIPE